EQERAVTARFYSALEEWEEGHLSDAQFAALLEKNLLPAWKKARKALPPSQGSIDIRSAGPVLPQMRRLKESPGQTAPKPKGAPTEKEFRELLHLYAQARAEAWGGLKVALSGGGLSMDAMLDLLVVEMLRERLDEMANEGNPLRDCFEFSRG